MSEYTGQLVNKSERDWNGTMLYSFQLKGENIWFRTGTQALTLEEGTWISFQADPQTKKVVLSSMKTVDTPTDAELAKASASSTPSASTSGGSTATTREDYWTNRERLDSVRTARADATRIVCAALAHDHLPHAASTGKGKRLDLLIGYVKEITEELISYEEK